MSNLKFYDITPVNCIFIILYNLMFRYETRVHPRDVIMKRCDDVRSVQNNMRDTNQRRYSKYGCVISILQKKCYLHYNFL